MSAADSPFGRLVADGAPIPPTAPLSDRDPLQAGDPSAGARVGDERLLAIDRGARAQAQTRFDRPLVLEAGAGTGKTTALVARLLAWCLGPGWEKASSGPAPAAVSPAAAPAAAGAIGAVGAIGAIGARATVGADAGAVAARVLRGVVAVTFTEAAAAEMAQRAALELAALARGKAPASWLSDAVLPAAEELARRAVALTAALDHLMVQTIHGFCLGLLTTHPLEAGVHPQLTVDADGSLLAQVIAEVIEGALRQGYGAPGDPHLLALAAAGLGPREIADTLAILAAADFPAADLVRDPLADGAWPRLRARLAAACGELCRLAAPRLAGSSLKLANALMEALLQLVVLGEASGGAPPVVESAVGGSVRGGSAPSDDAALDADIAAVAHQIAALLPANLRTRLKDWSKGTFNKQEAARLDEVRAPLGQAAAAVVRLADHCAALDPVRLRHGRLALAPLLAAVEAELRRRGIVTFDALLRGAARLLAGHPEVRRAVRQTIDQLLVDEFQDTDATQCEVLRWLALDGPAAERPGLFLVGDPKQSIYGWRSADLRSYEGFVADVRAAGGEVLPLVENFRSVPAILSEVGAVMEPLLCARPGVQPGWTPLLPCERRRADRGFRAGGRAPVEHWVSWLPDDDRDPQAACTEMEAAAIAADLRRLHEREGAAWRDAAILLRSTGDLDVYLEALRRAAIPFAVARDKQYFRRREVIDAAALVRAVLDPGDHLALVTWLRSPLVGVPDAALLPLWRRDLPRLLTDLHAPLPLPLAAVRAAVESAAAAVPAGVPGGERLSGWPLVLVHAIEQLAVLRQAAVGDPADVFVERLRRLLLVDATAAARYLGNYRLANLDRFFRQLIADLEAGAGDLTALLRTLRASIAAGRDAEEGRPPEGGQDAVQVLTVHGAKGLDFTHVYLPQLNKAANPDRPADTEPGRQVAIVGADGGVTRREYRLLGVPTPGFDEVAERRREVEAAERVRTLYVAMTRAKDRLVMAGAWPRNERAPVPQDQARTHLQLLGWRPASPDLGALWRAERETAVAAGGLSAGGSTSGSSPTTGTPMAAGLTGGGLSVAAPDVLWRFPALALAGVGPAETAAAPAGAGARAEDAASAGALVSLDEVAAQALRLAAHRRDAARRMARPYGGAASEEAHARLREQVAARRSAEAGEADAGEADAGEADAGGTDAGSGSPDREDGVGGDSGGGWPGPAVAADREAAMAAGAALHRALELWDLAAAPEVEAVRQRAILPAYLAAAAFAGDLAAAALPRCAALLDRFVASGLAARLAALAPHVIAREMPLLLSPLSLPLPLPPPHRSAGPLGPPAPAAPAAPAAGAVAFVAGAIDLLYRDPASGELVIADYKTDEVSSSAQLAGRAAVYGSQGAVYVSAVQGALGLATPPRFELWFVRAGQVVTVPPPPLAANAPSAGSGR